MMTRVKFSKLKWLSTKMADVVRAIQSFFAINERLWLFLKSHWISHLIGPIFFIGATFSVMDAYKNLKKAGNKSFDKLFAFLSSLLFQLMLLIGIVVCPIAVAYGATGLMFFTPFWIISALVVNSVYLLAQLLNHTFRFFSHDDVKEQQKNQLSVYLFLQKGFASALMTAVLIMVQFSLLNTFSLAVIAAISTLSSIVCLTYDLFKHKVEPTTTKEMPLVTSIKKEGVEDKKTNYKLLFSHANRVFQVKNMSYQKAKDYLIKELIYKLNTYQHSAKTVKNEQKLRLMNELRFSLNNDEVIVDKDKILEKYPLAFQSLSVLSGKSDVEDIYDACLYWYDKLVIRDECQAINTLQRQR